MKIGFGGTHTHWEVYMIIGDVRYLLTDAKIHYIFHIQIVSLQKSFKAVLFYYQNQHNAII